MIIDEAQNTTPVQMKMVLTRLGQNSHMVITGDLSQIDLPIAQPSGLAEAVTLLDNIRGVGIIHLRARMWFATLWWRVFCKLMKLDKLNRIRRNRSETGVMFEE